MVLIFCAIVQIVLELSPFGDIILLYSVLLIFPRDMRCREGEGRVFSSLEICF